MLKGIEAAGFAWVQVHSPPRSVLVDRARAALHARALRGALDTAGLRLVLHGADDLSAGTPEHDRALDGLLDYAAATGAELVVYHGANFPVADGGEAAARMRDRQHAEAASLRARVRRLERLGVTLAIENLAPVWPGPPRLCHQPEVVRDLVLRLASARVRMLFDVGHAHIAADLAGGRAPDLLEAVRDQVGLFHVHDNLGARTRGTGGSGLDPLRLDLHLPPGSGRVSWDALAPVLLEGDVPLVLEVHPPNRPEPLSLADVTSELLLHRRHAVSAARTTVSANRPAGARSSVPPG